MAWVRPVKGVPIQAALAALLLAGCAPERDDPLEPTQANAAAPQPEAKPASRPATTQSAPALEATDYDLSVEAEGVRVVAGPTGAFRRFPFGTPRTQLLGVLESYRGTADSGTNSECGAGPLDYAVWADGLTLYFQQGRFAGWALDERAAGAHSTVSGIGPGSTRRALDAAYDAKIQQTTLGTEFSAGGLSGVLNGAGQNARVTAMWAGVSCVFR